MFSKNRSIANHPSVPINAFPPLNPVNCPASALVPNASRFRNLFPVGFFAWAFIFLAVLSPALAKDCWLSVHGAGLRDGTSPENAYAASKDKRGRSAQKCWAKTSPDGTLYVLEGRYSIADGTFWSLKINKTNDGPDGDPSGKKKLVGLGRVSIEGSRVIPYSPAYKETGETWLEIQEGAKQLHVENFKISRVAIGISAAQGSNNDLSFKKLDFQDTRQNLVLYGHPDCRSRDHCKASEKGSLTHHVSIEKVNGVRYSKRHVRLTHGIFDVEILDSSADSQFQEGDFAVGFDVENPSHDIEFRKCVARGNLFKDPVYWNGDGFKAEGETENIRWIHCAAMDNADAGFDVKSSGAVLDQIIASGNGRNIRIWSSRETQLKNITSTRAHQFGGKGAPSGLWIQGVASCQNCNIFANPTQILLEGKGRLTLRDSLVTAGKNETLIVREDGTQLKMIRTKMRKDDVPFKDTGTAEKNPKQPSPSKT